MENALVVVESAAKAKTIERFLGGSFRVMASGGHVRDLPQRGLSVDIANGFRPQFEVVPDRAKILDSLKRAARKASTSISQRTPTGKGKRSATTSRRSFSTRWGPTTGFQSSGSRSTRSPRRRSGERSSRLVRWMRTR